MKLIWALSVARGEPAADSQLDAQQSARLTRCARRVVELAACYAARKRRPLSRDTDMRPEVVRELRPSR